MAGEKLRAEQAFLLAGHGGEQDRAAWAVAGLAEGAGDLDQGGDAGGIVHRAIVDPVGIRRIVGAGVADADMVEMRHQQHIFAGDAWIAPGQDADHIGAGEAGDRAGAARDAGVKEAMQAFRRQLQEAQGKALTDSAFSELQQRSYQLALALQGSIESSWQINLGH